jgi:hypothetical protein
MEESIKIIKSKNWSAELCPAPETPFKFEYHGREALHLAPVSSGMIAESSGIVKKSRIHERVDRLSCTFEYENVIPFGSEPLIKRNFEFAANHVKVTFDFDLRRPIALQRIEVDPLFLPGKWKRFCVISAIVPGQGIPEIEWQNIADGTQTLYKSSNPFLICLVEDFDGRILEIGAGDDLWRWSVAEKLENAHGDYAITASDAGITITRIPLVFNEKTECGKRNWRFKWYFAWSHAGYKAPALSRKAVKLSAPGGDPVPDSALTAVDEGKFLPGTFCFQAPAAERRLKKIIRSAAGKTGCEFLFPGIEPHVCCSAAHLDRGNKKSLLHWDMMSILDFYLWANQQLDLSDSNLAVRADKTSPAMSLPSISGIARPVQRITGKQPAGQKTS